MKVMYFDIETTAIPPEGSQGIKAIHAIGIKVNDEPVLKFTRYYLGDSDGSLQKAVRLLNTADLIVSFNGINFDIPVIERILNVKLTAKHLDLIIIGKLLFTKDNLMTVDPKLMPDEKGLWGRFSLRAFGRRVGKAQKEEYSDWSRLTTNMINYMVADVEVTADIHKFFLSVTGYPTEDVIELEQYVAEVIAQQERYGFYFDQEKARILNLRLNREKLQISHKLAKVFKPKFLPDGKPVTPKKAIRRKKYLPNENYKHPRVGQYVPKICKRQKNGKLKLPAKNKYKYFDKPHRLVYVVTEGEHQKIVLTQFNPGSRAHIVKWLKDMYEWEPEIYTPTGNPKTDADTLDNLTYPEAAPLKRYLKLVKDLGQLANGDNSLLNLVCADGRFHGRCDSLGTNTGRMSHSKPNITQVPKGKDFRELMAVPDGKVLIDVDADALELVMLGHYLGPYDEYYYAKTVDSGDKKANPPTDIHSVNQRATGLPTRDLAKTFIYGLTNTVTTL